MTAETLPTVHLATLERLAIVRALEETKGNRVHAARHLGIHVRTLHRKLREREVALAVSASEGTRAAVVEPTAPSPELRAETRELVHA